MQVNTSVTLLSVQQFDDGGLLFTFSDNPLIGMYFVNIDAFAELIQQVTPYNDLLKKVLMLDWSQEFIAGKTATLNCTDPNDIWVIGT